MIRVSPALRLALRLALLGFAAFGLALLFVFPVRWITGVLPSTPQCARWYGSIWQGGCERLSIATTPQPLLIDSLHWKVHPAALLKARLQLTAEANLKGTAVSGVVTLGTGGYRAVQALAFSGVLDNSLLSALPAGWRGNVHAQDLVSQMRGNELLGLSGTVTVRELKDRNGVLYGDFKLDMPVRDTPPFKGTLRSLGGMLDINATVTIAGDMSWQLDGVVAAGASAPPSLLNTLQMLGPADAGGRRPISAAGTLR
jgi:hypothetical protein